MQDFEKLGVFYLGRVHDPAAGRTTDVPLLYDARDLTTHAVVLGMTGSGKTGLCIAMLEEAAIDGIPALVIDPKGDIANLLLTFPDLQAASFRPWIDEAEAARRGLSADAFAQQTAADWKAGLERWGQDGGRIGRLREAAEVTVYTPGCTTGRPLQVLRSLAAPGPSAAQDPGAMRDRVLTAVSGLLGLVGLPADPVQSREHVLLSTLLDRAWREGRSLELAGLIQEVQKPPFEKVGVLDLESFYPAKERFGLAMALNNLLASPGFSAWMEGDPLDIQRLLYSPQGRPRVSILSIAHLSDAERMFFVTILLNEVLSWVRAQSGTGSLRALLYMDEIYGYVPPTANPPSKTPLLTLLKQARAYGLGCVLATQNPVDLDYKGLANAGTWLIGRLQTERDRLRVLEGLEGAAAAAGGSFDRAAVETLLAGLANRVFLMRNVHEPAPILFESRWALSYLRGPMTLPQIRQAMAAAPVPAGGLPVPAPAPGPVPTPVPPPSAAVPQSGAARGSSAAPAAAERPVLAPGNAEYFLKPAAEDPSAGIVYRPRVLGVAQLHFVDAKARVDAWVTRTLIAPLGDDGFAAWNEAESRGDIKADLEPRPRPGAAFAELPAAAARASSAAAWRKTLATHLYQKETLDLLSCPAVKLTSMPGEAEGDFRARLALALREQRDGAVDRLRAKYTPRLRTLADQVRRAEERVEREQAQASQQKIQTALSMGAAVLGAFLGRRAARAGTLGRATTAMRSASRIGKEADDVARAGRSAAVVKERWAAMERECEEEVAALQGAFDPAAAEIVRTQVRPRKSDIALGAVGLLWVP